VARRADRQREALRRARLRRRERDAAEVQPNPEAVRAARLSNPATPDAELRRLAATTCAWCDGAIETKPRGRIPKWCSAACRQRAWVQRQAAESGRAPVEVVGRRVEVPVAARAVPRHGEWQPLLVELARQLDTGAVYERDLEALLPAFERLILAARRAVGRSR
jgi:hypothetical protein